MGMFERIKTVAFTVGIGVFYYAKKGLTGIKNVVLNTYAEVGKRRNSTDSNTTFVANANFGEKNNEVESDGVKNPQTLDDDAVDEASDDEASVVSTSEFGSDDENEGYLDVVGAEDDDFDFTFEGFEENSAEEGRPLSNEAPDSDDASTYRDDNYFDGFGEEGDGYLAEGGADASSGNKIDITASALKEFGEKLQGYSELLTQDHRKVLEGLDQYHIVKLADNKGSFQRDIVDEILTDLNQYDLSIELLSDAEERANKKQVNLFLHELEAAESTGLLDDVFIDNSVSTSNVSSVPAHDEEDYDGEYGEPERDLKFDGLGGDDDNYLSLEKVQERMEERRAGGEDNDGAPDQEDEGHYLKQSDLLPSFNRSAASIANDGLKATAASQKKESTDGPSQERDTGHTLGG